MDAMTLIDLYAKEVGRNLPVKMRDDIEKETRSLIEDMLEDEAAKQGRQPDEQMTVDVLKRMGPPEKMAASYQPPSYLIGPKYYATFMMVLRIVLSVLFILSAIGLGIQLGQTTGTPADYGNIVARGLVDMLGALIAAFGNVVLVFAILQWLIPEPKFDQKEWDPRAMKAEPDPEQVKTFDMVAGIVGNAILLLLLNVYPQWLGVNWMVNGDWVHIRALTDAFFRFVPYMSVLLAGGIGLYAYLLRQEKWNIAARVTQILLHLASIVMLALMITGPALAGFDPAELSRVGWLNNAGSVSSINNALNLGMRMALGISLVMQVIDAAKMLLRIIGSRVSLPAGLAR